MKDLFDLYRSYFDEAVDLYLKTVDELPCDNIVDISNFITFYFETFFIPYRFVKGCFNDYYEKLGSGGEE